jgi:hypothetical protein
VKHAAATLTDIRRISYALNRYVSPFISPYLPLLAVHLRSPLSDLLQHFRSERASQSIYCDIVKNHSQVNQGHLSDFPFALKASPEPKPFVVCGAGPSLNDCINVLKTFRDRICIIAVSGAIPALLCQDINPDWVIAFEARETVLDDLKDLPITTRVIVFPSTHPSVMSKSGFTFYSGTDSNDALETRGGTSVIPALDFAIRLAKQFILLCGVDLSNENGTYAIGSKRENHAGDKTSMPKFAAMRIGLESLIYRRKELISTPIYHFTTGGTMQFRGTQAVKTDQLTDILNSNKVAAEHA